jgi:GrpB-like predicted nucleotidyltransferase (UPF0157 family)
VTTTELVGGIEKRALILADYDPQWPEMYSERERRIRTALGTAAVHIAHIGSTSVFGLAAKPIIDVLTKRALIEQDWADMNAYAEVKTEVIAEIKERARKPQA